MFNKDLGSSQVASLETDRIAAIAEEGAHHQQQEQQQEQQHPLLDRSAGHVGIAVQLTARAKARRFAEEEDEAKLKQTKRKPGGGTMQKQQLQQLKAGIRIRDAALHAQDAVLQAKDSVIENKNAMLQAKDAELHSLQRECRLLLQQQVCIKRFPTSKWPWRGKGPCGSGELVPSWLLPKD